MKCHDSILMFLVLINMFDIIGREKSKKRQRPEEDVVMDRRHCTPQQEECVLCKTLLWFCGRLTSVGKTALFLYSLAVPTVSTAILCGRHRASWWLDNYLLYTRQQFFNKKKKYRDGMDHQKPHLRISVGYLLKGKSPGRGRLSLLICCHTNFLMVWSQPFDWVRDSHLLASAFLHFSRVERQTALDISIRLSAQLSRHVM